MAASDAKGILASMAHGGLAANIAKQAAMREAGACTHDAEVGRPAMSTIPRMAWGVHKALDDDSSSDDEEMDMDALRHKAKMKSKAVVDSGGLCADAAQKTNGKGPWASMTVLSEAIEVLHEIVSQPREAWMTNERPMPTEPATSLQTVDVVTSTPRSAIPSSSSAQGSRHSSKTSASDASVLSPDPPISTPQPPPKAPERTDFQISPSLPWEKPVNNREMCSGLGETRFRPTSPAMLPPLKIPAKMTALRRPPASSSSSAMDMDLGFGKNQRGAPPLLKRQSQSLGSLRANVSKQASGLMLPSLSKGANMRTGQLELRSSSIERSARSLVF